MSGNTRYSTGETLFKTFIGLVAFGLFSLLSTPSYAQYYSFDHKDCTIRTKSYSEQVEGDKRLLHHIGLRAIELLVTRKFKTKPMFDNKRVLPGELYFELSLERPKEHIFTSCIVEITVRQAERGFPSAKDKILFQKMVKRKVPRITLGGKERCVLALENAFVHVPTCKEMNP